MAEKTGRPMEVACGLLAAINIGGIIVWTLFLRFVSEFAHLGDGAPSHAQDSISGRAFIVGPYIYFGATVVWCLAGASRKAWRPIALFAHVALLPLMLISFTPQAIFPFGLVVVIHLLFSIYVVLKAN